VWSGAKEKPDRTAGGTVKSAWHAARTCVRACKATVGKVQCVQSLGGCMQNDDRCVLSGQHYNQCDKATNKDQARERDEREREIERREVWLNGSKRSHQ